MEKRITLLAMVKRWSSDFWDSGDGLIGPMCEELAL